MLITLVSAAGSPGVTTTALALALRWPRPVLLVEADPTGGSGMLAGFFRAQLDQPGMVDLVIAHRSDLLADALPKLLVPLADSKASVLVGVRTHEQASGVAQLWSPLLGVLRGLDPAATDVIVDAGRLGLNGWPVPLVSGSDITLLLTYSDLPGLAPARSWAAALAAEDAPGHATRLLVVGEGRPYGAREVSRTLGVPVLGSVGWAPALARVFSHGELPPTPSWWRRFRRGELVAGAAFESSAYIKSIDAIGETLRSTTAETARPFRSVLAQAESLPGRTTP